MLPGLKGTRMSKGLSQEQLSDESGVHRDTIHKLETGQRPARPATISGRAGAPPPAGGGPSQRPT